MNNQEKKEFSSEILNNGKPFLKGDSNSLKIIFRNITGQNAASKEYFDFVKSQGAEPGEFTLKTPDEDITANVIF